MESGTKFLQSIIKEITVLFTHGEILKM